MSKLNNRQRKARRMIKEQTELMGWLTAGKVMEGAKGTPYVLLGSHGSPKKASVCFFFSTRTFRVFAPNPMIPGDQIKFTFADPKLAAACANRLHEIGAEAYVLWVAAGGVTPGTITREEMEKRRSKPLARVREEMAKARAEGTPA